MSTAVLKTNAPAPHAEEELREMVPEEESEGMPPAAKRKPKQVRKRFVVFCIVLFLFGAWLVTPVWKIGECGYHIAWGSPLYLVVGWQFPMSGYSKTGVYFFPNTFRSIEDVWNECEAPVTGLTFAEVKEKEGALELQRMNQWTAIEKDKQEQNKKDNRKAFEKRQAELEAKKAAQGASEKAAAESAAPEDVKAVATESEE